MRRALAFGIACTSAAASLIACFVTIDDSKIRHDGDDAAGDAAVDAALDAPTDVLDGDCPNAMVKVPFGDAGFYCVDSTETTLDEYGAFVDAADPPAAGSQVAACAWNASFKPPGWGNGTVGNRPVGGLDWCDAYAYCKWAGKRLCGRIGGGALDPNGATNAGEGQWFTACTRNGARAYPYGASYEAGVCVGRDWMPMPQGPEPVGKATACVGGYDGIFDMSGNVEELIDSCLPDKLCDGGPECELCIMMGGGWANRGTDMSCSYENQVLRKGQYDDNGVRCCWP
jgi:formylglycine-generating enzyme required for sulfatase activity